MMLKASFKLLMLDFALFYGEFLTKYTDHYVFRLRSFFKESVFDEVHGACALFSGILWRTPDEVYELRVLFSVILWRVFDEVYG